MSEKAKSMSITKVTRYKCPLCDELWETEEEAVECAVECAARMYHPEEETAYKCMVCGEVFEEERLANHHAEMGLCAPRADRHHDFLCEGCVHLTAEGYFCVDCKNRHPRLPLSITDTCPDFERALR